MRYLIKNGSIIDPAQRVATIGNVLVEHGKVVQVFDMADLTAEVLPVGDDTEIINARGAVIAPGFIDLHTYLCEPGDEHKETIATATQAAARGGFTTICAMPNTKPIVDNAAIVRQLRELARRRGIVRVESIAALTVGCQGELLTEMADLIDAGAIGFSDAGRSITNATVMRNALAYAAMFDIPVLTHCEDRMLTRGSAMNEGAIATRLGLPGAPAVAEEMLLARDLLLAEETGAHLHVCRVSTAGSVALIRAAKERGVRVTAEVTAHHLTLSDRWVLGALGQWHAPGTPDPRDKRQRRQRRTKSEPGLGLPSWFDPLLLPPYDPSTRVQPPLRSENDVEALIEGLRDGTLDIITSGHEPQSYVEKEQEYRLAESGISSLETTLGLALSLVHRGELDLVQLVAKFTEGPALVLRRAPATLRPGARADIVIFDPDQSWNVDPNDFASKCKYTPIAGQQLKGQVMLAMAGGQIVFRRGAFGISTGVLRQASRLEGILDES
jgi:dihydroorotase